MRAILVTLLAVVLVVGAACDREESEVVPPSSTPASTAKPAPAIAPESSPASPTVGPPGPGGPPTPAPQRPLPPDARPLAGAALIDAASGAVTVLYEGATYAHAPRFEADGSIWLNLSRIGEWRHFDAEGRLIETRRTSPEHWCPQYGAPDFGRFTIGGRTYDGTCSSIAPAGQYVYFSVDVAVVPDPEAPMGGASEAWLLRVSDGTRTRLTDRVGYMRNWEGYPAAAWSASGRYLIFDETHLLRPDERRTGESAVATSRYLVDTDAATVSVLEMGRHGFLPGWSPREDAFVMEGPGGTAEVVRLPSATTLSFPDLPWLPYFDGSGRYVFTSTHVNERSPSNERTIVAEAETGKVVARWRGLASAVSQFQERPVGFVGISVQDEGTFCRVGNVIYHPLLAGGERCVPDIGVGAWKPGGAAIAYTQDARPAPKAVPYERDPYVEVMLLDLQSGRERRLFGSVAGLPAIRWRADGSKLLVSWPRPEGLCSLGPPDFLC